MPEIDFKMQQERADHWVAGYVEKGDSSAAPSGSQDISETPRMSQPQEAAPMEREATSVQAETRDSDGMNRGECPGRSATRHEHVSGRDAVASYDARRSNEPIG